MEKTPIPPGFKRTCEKYLVVHAKPVEGFKTVAEEDYKEPIEFFNRVSKEANDTSNILEKIKNEYEDAAELYAALRNCDDLEVALCINNDFMMTLRTIVKSAGYKGSVEEGCLFGLGGMLWLQRFHPDVFKDEEPEESEEIVEEIGEEDTTHENPKKKMRV